jgi:hypothetical protein
MSDFAASPMASPADGVASPFAAAASPMQPQPLAHPALHAATAYNDLLDALGAMRNSVVYGTKVRAPHSLVVYGLWSSAPWPDVFRRVALLTAQHALRLGVAAALFKLGVAALRRANAGRPLPWHHALMGACGGYAVWGGGDAVSTQVNLYMFSRVLAALVGLYGERRQRAEAKLSQDAGAAAGSGGVGAGGNAAAMPRDTAAVAVAASPTSAVSPGAAPPASPSQGALPPPETDERLAWWERFALGPRGYRVFAGLVWAAALYLFHEHGAALQPSLRQSMQFIYRDGDHHGGSLRKLLLGV